MINDDCCAAPTFSDFTPVVNTCVKIVPQKGEELVRTGKNGAGHHNCCILCKIIDQLQPNPCTSFHS